MKLRVLTATLLSLGLVSGVYAAGAELKTDADKLSYTIGYDMGSQFSKQKVTIDTTVFQQGLTDGLAGNQPALTAEQQKAVMENLQKTMMQKMQTELKVQGEQNLKAGEQFLKANKKKPGVKVTKSGLQYKVEEMGAGPKPTAADTVTVDYEGTFIDKKVFDSSYQRGQPVSFPLNGVIPGWTEAVQLMPVGSTFIIYVPSKLAYGEQAPGAIGPNKTLIFKIKLISIEKPKAAAAAMTATPAAEALAVK